MIKVQFKDKIDNNTLPSKLECECFKKKHGSGRKWSHVKDFVRNYLNRIAKEKKFQ